MGVRHSPKAGGATLPNPPRITDRTDLRIRKSFFDKDLRNGDSMSFRPEADRDLSGPDRNRQGAGRAGFWGPGGLLITFVEIVPE
jgi:hypothetical protein